MPYIAISIYDTYYLLSKYNVLLLYSQLLLVDKKVYVLQAWVHAGCRWRSTELSSAAPQHGFACVRDFLRLDDERIVTLTAPDRRDAADYECPATAQTVRLVRHIASTGRVRVLMTNLLDPEAFPAYEFGALYHQRLRIEGAFKRLKHRLNLEHVSGLSQQAALHDFAAKIVCDNLQSLATETALREAAHQPRNRPLHPQTATACAAARRRHRHASARRTTIDRRPHLLAPP